MASGVREPAIARPLPAFYEFVKNHLVIVDKAGRAFVEVGGEAWSGVLAAAGAKAVIVESAGGTGRAAPALSLQIELGDAEFECERLAKRRFSLMQGWSREQLLVWTDRIEILARPRA